jgi:hypothetical protein
MSAINYVAVDGSMETTIRSDTPRAHPHIYIYILHMCVYTSICIPYYICIIETDDTRIYNTYTLFKRRVCVCVCGGGVRSYSSHTGEGVGACIVSLRSLL